MVTVLRGSKLLPVVESVEESSCFRKAKNHGCQLGQVASTSFPNASLGSTTVSGASFTSEFTRDASRGDGRFDLGGPGAGPVILNVS